MAVPGPFYDEMPGPERRDTLNELYNLWEGAIGNIIKGDAGWSPLIRAATSGNKVALELYDWTGGEGTKPAQTGYLGPAGYVATIGEAIDFRGPVGLTGPANTLTMGTVTTGAPGDPASATVTGTAPNQTLNLTLPQGATGPANTLAIGTVETGAAGAPASATVTGQAPNQTLNLTLPRGNTGDTGATPAISAGPVTTGAPGTPAAVTVTGTPAAPILNFTIPAGQNGTGTGDVNGPAVAVADQMVQFSGTTGKLVKALTATGMLKFVNGVPSAAQAGTDYMAGAVSLASGTNLDTIRTPGDYWIDTDVIAAACTNVPVAKGGALSVEAAGGGVGVGAIQTYTTHDPAGRIVYQRSIAFSGGTWTTWSRFYTELNPPSILIRGTSPGNSNTTARTAVAVAEYRGQNNPTGAIVFSAPDGLGFGGYRFNVVGGQHTFGHIYDETLAGYRSNTGVWTTPKRTSLSTTSLKVRFGTSPSGAATIILGDVDTVWAYPHFTLMSALVSDPMATTAHLQGWTANVVTDLTAYTSVSSEIPIAATTAVATRVDPVAITSGDLNDFIVPGDYYISTNAVAATIVNIPEQLAGALEVHLANSPGVIQTYTTYWNGNTRKIYQRARISAGNSWGTWARVYTTIDQQTESVYVGIANGVNLNTLVTPGFYFSGSTGASQTMTNKPPDMDRAFGMQVLNTGGNGGTGPRLRQIITSYSSTKNEPTWVRSADAGAWSPWVMQFDADNPGSDMPIGSAHIGLAKPDTGTWLDPNTVYLKSSYPSLANLLQSVSDGTFTGTLRAMGATLRWMGVAHGAGLFVAIAQSAAGSATTQYATSPDGITWTLRIMPSAAWHAIIYANGLFVALAASGIGATSVDGINWTARTIPSGVGTWKQITYGNGLFVAITSTNSTTNIWTSPDGWTWTSRTSPIAFTGEGVAFGNGRYVAAGYTASTGILLTSEDGITWTQRSLPSTARRGTVVFGQIFVVSPSTSTTSTEVIWSADGIVWTPVTIPSSTWGPLAYGNGTYLMLGAGSGGNTNALTSRDAISWYSQILPGAYNWLGLAFGDDIFAAVAMGLSTAGIGNSASIKLLQYDTATQFYLPRPLDVGGSANQWVKAL